MSAINITLTHKFTRTCHDLTGLLTNCNKIFTYINRLEQQSVLYPDRYDPNIYKGDGLELFVEALLKISPADNRLGIGQYRVLTEDEIDTGVDGVGVGVNGRPATVQVKYRSKTDQLLTANDDHLSNFTSASMMHYGVDPKDTVNMLIITTAKGLHHFTDCEMFSNKVRCIGIGDSEHQGLRDLVDNNPLFWNMFRSLCNC